MFADQQFLRGGDQVLARLPGAPACPAAQVFQLRVGLLQARFQTAVQAAAGERGLDLFRRRVGVEQMAGLDRLFHLFQ